MGYIQKIKANQAEKGSVTLMTLIMLTAVLTFGVLLISAGVSAIRTENLISRLQYAVMSAAASYDEALLEDYGLFALDGESIGTAVFSEYLRSTVERGSIKFGCSIQETSVLKRQINSEMKYKSALMTAEKFIETLKSLTLSDKADILREKGDDGSTFKMGAEMGVDELIDTAKGLISSSVGINIPDISGQEILNGLSTYFSTIFGEGKKPDTRWLVSRGVKAESEETEESEESEETGYGAEFLDKISQAVKHTGEKINLCCYVLDKLTHYGKGTDRIAFYGMSETEYVIFGHGLGAKNIESSFDTLMLIRMAINFADNVVNIKIPEPAALLATASAAAIIQSYADLLLLMGGEEAPLIPSNDQITASYEDYLMLMLLMGDEELMLQRLKEIININLRKGSKNERGIEDYFTVLYGSLNNDMQLPMKKSGSIHYTYEYRK